MIKVPSSPVDHPAFRGFLIVPRGPAFGIFGLPISLWTLVLWVLWLVFSFFLYLCIYLRKQNSELVAQPG
jgi:hypothetical protein